MPLTLAVGADGRVTGTLGPHAVVDGALDASWDALRFRFTVPLADGLSVTHGLIRGGRLEATTSTQDGALTVWSAVRAE
jgi:hypothetical protein